jgi:hypothetical protein
MKFLLIVMFLIPHSYAWDFNAKTGFQKSTTDNVNLSNTTIIAESFNTIDGYLQAKNDEFKFKLKAKQEKYATQIANDNYLVDLSMQYKHSKKDDYTIDVFKQVYNGASIVSTDTTSDNKGGKISATFTMEFTPEISGYITPTLISKKYPKIANRTDKVSSIALGIENNISSNLMINPELAIQKINSGDSYYSNSSYGPLLFISYDLNDNWNFVVDTSYAITDYNNRTVTLTGAKGKKTIEDEKQKLFNITPAITYSFEKYVSLIAKYSVDNNSSNNTTAAYSAKVTSLNIGIKF